MNIEAIIARHELVFRRDYVALIDEITTQSYRTKTGDIYIRQKQAELKKFESVGGPPGTITVRVRNSVYIAAILKYRCCIGVSFWLAFSQWLGVLASSYSRATCSISSFTAGGKKRSCGMS